MKRILLFLALLAEVLPSAAQTKLNAAGATFPNPIYSKWFSTYHQMHPDIEINYQSIGSGGGIAQLKAGTVDFGASDMPLDDTKVKQMPMQFLQLLQTPDERIDAMRCARAHLRKGGLFPAAVFDLAGEATGDEYIPPLPDMYESHGWVWSTQATGIRLHDGGTWLTLERLRRAVSPSGEIAETEDRVRLEVIRPEQLEEEMRAAGIEPIERWVIRPTDEHVGSDVVLGEVRDA